MVTSARRRRKPSMSWKMSLKMHEMMCALHHMQVSHGNSRSTSPHRGGSHARRRQVPQGRTRNVAGEFFAAEAARDLLAIFPLHVLLVEHHESPVGGHLLLFRRHYNLRSLVVCSRWSLKSKEMAWKRSSQVEGSGKMTVCVCC